MASKSKVSVVIPIYNTGRHIDSCIYSVINQTYTNLEIILIDDGSTDNTDTLCKDYARFDSRVHYYYKENGGVSSARNLGINKATGKYITFIDSDDVIAKETIDILVSSISKADIALINEKAVLSTNNISHTNVTNNSLSISGIDASKMLLYENGINNTIHGLMYCKKIANGLFFNENIAYGEDHDFKFRLLIRAKNVILNSAVGYFYVKHDDSAMQVPFTNKRADSLKATLNNLDYATSHAPVLVRAAKHKVFLESLSVLRAINDTKSHKSFYNECILQIKRYREGVTRDKSAPFHHRVYAIIASVNIPLLLVILNFRNKLLRR